MFDKRRFVLGKTRVDALPCGKLLLKSGFFSNTVILVYHDQLRDTKIGVFVDKWTGDRHSEVIYSINS
jgi:hypothetical protein